MSRSSRDNSPDERIELPYLLPSRSNCEAALPAQSAQRAGADDRDHEVIEGCQVRGRGLEREHFHSLPDSDVQTLTEIGIFRALEFNDLARHRYHSDLIEARKHLAKLSRAGLVRSRISYPERAVYVTLTPAGHQYLATSPERENSRQQLYHGFVKTREARHDAALYRLYQQESGRIERMGGRVRRIVLDFELKHSINRRLANLNSLSRAEQIRERRQIAQDHGLRVVNGKITLPDLRLEYEGPDQQLAKVDLELVTKHYHRGLLAARAKAGFAMYAFAEDAARLRPAMEDPEIMQDILSL
jgi:DNA-binding MarR family transcriptional regulator